MRVVTDVLLYVVPISLILASFWFGVRLIRFVLEDTVVPAYKNASELVKGKESSLRHPVAVLLLLYALAGWIGHSLGFEDATAAEVGAVVIAAEMVFMILGWGFALLLILVQVKVYERRSRKSKED